MKTPAIPITTTVGNITRMSDTVNSTVSGYLRLHPEPTDPRSEDHQDGDHAERGGGRRHRKAVSIRRRLLQQTRKTGIKAADSAVSARRVHQVGHLQSDGETAHLGVNPDSSP